MSIYRKTPIMGWASWNCFRTDISEEKIKEQIDALISMGLADCGYTYCNMDDGFFGGRSRDGKPLFHKERFPNGIKVISDYAHSKGLMAGIYADGGDKTCGFYYDGEGDNGDNVGLYGFEEQDLNIYLDEYGFDFIKVDWCGGLRLGLDEREQYTRIGNIIEEIRRKTGRQLVYNICRWQFPGAWAAETADSWRTGADIVPCFESVMRQIDVIKPLRKYCSPGHVNDLDMMQIGNGMDIEEERTHFAMWCMMSTPLIIGCDLTKIEPEALEILKNRELIAVNQDSACLQAYVVKETRDGENNLLGEVWVKDLGKANSACKAVAYLNRSDKPLDISARPSELGLGGAALYARDLRRHADTDISRALNVRLKPRETAVFKIECESARPAHDLNEPPEKTSTPAFVKITADRAEELYKNGAYLVDVREKPEYDRGSLKGAINIPYTDIHALAESVIPDKERGVILYCKTGKRSAQAKTSLEYLGYRNIYCLGGIEQ